MLVGHSLRQEADQFSDAESDASIHDRTFMIVAALLRMSSVGMRDRVAADDIRCMLPAGVCSR